MTCPAGHLLRDLFQGAYLRDGILLGEARKKLGGASEHFLSTFAVHSSRNARLLLGICSLRLSEQKPNMLPACGGIA